MNDHRSDESLRLRIVSDSGAPGPADAEADAAAPTPPQWMGTQEAARYLGITPRTLYRFINDGSVPAFKMGRVIRLKQTDLDAFVESTRIAPGSLEHLTPELRSVADE